MTMRNLTGLALAALVACSAGAGLAADAKIGVVAPLTGPAANTGVAIRQGMELAVDEWNADGTGAEGDAPPKAELVFEDSNSKPEVGVSAAQRLLTLENVDLLIGEALHSHVTLAIMELAPQFGKPILSNEPVSTAIADKVRSDPERYAFYWKGNFNSDGYGTAVHSFYEWAIESGNFDPGNKKIAFVVEDTDYGLSNAEKIGELFEEAGWTVTATETAQVGNTDFFPQLSKLRSDPPDVVVSVFTAVNSGVSFVRQLDEQGLETSHLAIYYPTKPEFLEQIGDTANGMLWATLQFNPDGIAEHKEFADRVQAKFDQPATYSHAHAYCTMQVALRAIEKVGTDSSEALAAAIGETEYPCLLGTVDFGEEDHAAQSGPDFIPVPVAQVQGGKNMVVWPESVATSDLK